ncbi:toll-like receptor 7 [Emydura macquarii macquarii]|uniref:toll-like receptor 7 n=1 Tax=Emydura macquarii macquarii TaxID=1129001 RepID=UPI00352A1B23
MLWRVLLLTEGFLRAGAYFPQFPPCANSTDGRSVDCSMRNLSLIPNIRSINVTFLNLDDNFLSLLANGAFSSVPHLETLSVGWNCKPRQLRKTQKECQLLIQPGALVMLGDLGKLNLAGNSLARVPPLPSSLHFLDLSYNNILMLGFQDLARLSNMRELQLGYNCYYRNPCHSSVTLAGDTFKNMTSLRQLSLKFNNMSEVPQGLPPTLLKLDLSENKISHVSNLENLTNLISLNLEWNCQRCDHAAQPCFPCTNNKPLTFDTDAFQNLTNLRSLNLRGNSLQDLNASFFSSLSRLETLDLSDNFLTYAIRHGTFFSVLQSVQTLNLGYNYLSLVTFENLTLSASFGQMKALKILIINGYFFRNLAEDGIKALFNLSNLETLYFRTNFINNVNLSLFSRCGSLKFLSLSQNKIAFSQPCERNAHGAGAGTWGLSQEGALAENPWHWVEPERSAEEMVRNSQNSHLSSPVVIHCNKTLDLSFNSIQSIDPAQFKGLEGIDCLNLSYNYISQALNGSQFLTLPSLRLLDLSHNRFDLYYPSALQEVRHLVMLNLSNNQFHFTIKGLGHKLEFLTNLSSLKCLNLDNNQIGMRISKHLESSSLETLIFSRNRLDIMWMSGRNTYLEFFAKLPNLMLLDISFNNLDFIPGKVIDTLPKSLRNLSIAYNNLYDFPWDQMGTLGSLEFLDLSNNALETLTTGFYSKNLTTLNLSYNKLKSLHEKFFSNFSSLSFLNLNHNMIKLIDDTSFPDALLKSLQHLDMSNNPLRCTCEAHWFLMFLKNTSITIEHFSTSMQCDLPESKRGQPLLSMDPRSCQDIYGHLSFLCTSLIVTFMTVLPVLYKLYGWDFWYISHIFLAAVRRGYAPMSTPSCNEYDAFVAFDSQHSAVADWVYNEMVTQLEENGRRKYKLCLEERDWTAGWSRIENLCDSIYRSRKTIFILTRDGFRSGFLRHTFFITQQRLLDEKVDVVILVLLDTDMKMSKFLLARKRLCRRTVLDWPCNPFAQPYFWHCMRALLAHDIPHFYDSNLRRSIDSSGTGEFAAS